MITVEFKKKTIINLFLFSNFSSCWFLCWTVRRNVLLEICLIDLYIFYIFIYIGYEFIDLFFTPWRHFNCYLFLFLCSQIFSFELVFSFIFIFFFRSIWIDLSSKWSCQSGLSWESIHDIALSFYFFNFVVAYFFCFK